MIANKESLVYSLEHFYEHFLYIFYKQYINKSITVSVRTQQNTKNYA